MPFATLEVAVGEERVIGDCALTHAALNDPAVGQARVWLGNKLVCCLSEMCPQVSVSICCKDSSALLRCEGSPGAVVHILGRGASAGAVAMPSRTRKRRHAYEEAMKLRRRLETWGILGLEPGEGHCQAWHRFR